MTDRQLTAALLARDEAAIDWVMRKYTRLIWTVASAVLSRTAQREDVEECVADVFVFLWEHPEKFDPDKGKLKSWLAMMARNRAVDRWRQLSRQYVLPLEDTVLAEAAGLDEQMAAQETCCALRRAVEALEDRDREILLRRYWGEQKPREIALAMGIPVKQVENRLYRTKLRLRGVIDA